MGALDDLAEQPRNREDGHLSIQVLHLAGRNRHRVGRDDVLDGQLGQPLCGVGRQYWMDEDEVYIAGALALYKVDSLRDGTARVYFIVDDDDVTVLDVADDGQGLGPGVVSGAALLDECTRRIDVGGVVSALLGEAEVSCDHHRIFEAAEKIMLYVLDEHVGGG